MANQLKMAMIEAILALLGWGWSYRRIARELGVHRETGARYGRRGRSGPAKPAISTPGSETAELAHGPPEESRPSGRVSRCELSATPRIIKRCIDFGDTRRG